MNLSTDQLEKNTVCIDLKKHISIKVIKSFNVSCHHIQDKKMPPNISKNASIYVHEHGINIPALRTLKAHSLFFKKKLCTVFLTCIFSSMMHATYALNTATCLGPVIIKIQKNPALSPIDFQHNTTSSHQTISLNRSQAKANDFTLKHFSSTYANKKRHLHIPTSVALMELEEAYNRECMTIGSDGIMTPNKGFTLAQVYKAYFAAIATEKSMSV